MKFYENGEEDEELLKQQALKHLTKGCAIDDSLKESTIDVENDFGGASSEENQLEASPITVYATEYQESNAIKIAANETFCCYGIRNGLVRVLSQVSQSRSLLRGHETPIASMSFLPSTNEEENILATLSEDGTLLVRRLNEGREFGNDQRLDAVEVGRVERSGQRERNDHFERLFNRAELSLVS